MRSNTGKEDWEKFEEYLNNHENMEMQSYKAVFKARVAYMLISSITTVLTFFYFLVLWDETADNAAFNLLITFSSFLLAEILNSIAYKSMMKYGYDLYCKEIEDNKETKTN